MGTTSNKRLKDVLSFVNDHGQEKASEHFDLSISTLKRYRRKANERDLDIKEEFEQPKILVFDIETAPMTAYIWDTGNQYVSHENIVKDRSLISWSAKWLCGDEIISERVTVEEARERDDERLIKPLWRLIDECEVALGHNMKSFDKKVFNSRAIVNGLDQPSPYKVIDTYRQARRNFDFASNSLDYLTNLLCDDDKLDTSMELWRRCLEGDSSALEEMETYNRHDVRVNEDLHFKIRGWYTSGVNLGLYYDDIGDRCPRCGSKDLREGNNHYYTATGKYKTKRCMECGGIGRSRFCDISTEERKNIRRTLAR